MDHSQGLQHNEFAVHVQKVVQVTGMHQNECSALSIWNTNGYGAVGPNFP
jgi:EAL domain-containing protein (putative c-di-GMP-specific phosphodiesterase class I)